MKKFFEGINQQHIESQQSDFMMMLFGGPKIYGGRMPKDAHDHIMVTDELSIIVTKLLKDSLLEAQSARRA